MSEGQDPSMVGSTVIGADFSRVDTQSKPAASGHRRVTIVRAEVKDKKDPTKGKNVEIDAETVEANGEKRLLKAWVPTTSLPSLKRVALSAGMTDDDLRAGLNVTQLVGRAAVVFVKNEIVDDQATGEKREVSRLDAWLIPSDRFYANAI